MRPVRIFGTLVLSLVLATALAPAQADLGRIRLTGTVKAEDGSPIAGAKVVLRFLESERAVSRTSPRTLSNPETAAFETATNKKGLWTYAGLAAGRWEITATADGYNSALRTCKVLELADAPRVDLVLEKLAKGASATLAPGLLESADDLAFKKDYDGAIALYRQYLEIDPDAVMVLSAIGDCLLDKGDLEAALAQFQTVIDRTSKDPRETPLAARALARLGECHMKRGDKDEAVKSWRSSLALLPLDAEVPFNLAEVLFADRKLDQAGRYYRIAAELSPGWADPHYKLGLVYMGLEDFDRARQSFRKVVELDPYTPLAYQARDMLKGLDRIKK